MSLSFTPYIREAAHGRWNFPAEARDSEDFALNVCNANGSELLLTLGLIPMPNGDVMPIDVFANLVTAALRRHLGRRSPEIPTTREVVPGEITIIYPGREEGYIERRLHDLASLVQRSRCIGATHIGWQ